VRSRCFRSHRHQVPNDRKRQGGRPRSRTRSNVDGEGALPLPLRVLRCERASERTRDEARLPRGDLLRGFPPLTRRRPVFVLPLNEKHASRSRSPLPRPSRNRARASGIFSDYTSARARATRADFECDVCNLVKVERRGRDGGEGRGSRRKGM